MPPRDAALEANSAVSEQPKALELVSKALEAGGSKGVAEFAKQEADEEISGIHKLGTIDTSVDYPGSGEDVIKMKAANENAVKQVQEAQHTLELDLSEFGEAPVEAPAEAPKPVEKSAVVTPEVKPVEAPKSELEQALEETHAMISEQSGINPMKEMQQNEEVGKQFDQMMEETDPMAEEMERLTITDKEIAVEKKALQEFLNDKSVMTPLEQKYADSMQAHILYLVASSELSKAIIANKPAEEVAALKEKAEAAGKEAAKLAADYESDLKRFMNQDVEESDNETEEGSDAEETERVVGKDLLPSPMKTASAEYPLPKGGSEAPERKPGLISKLWSKAWKSMKFWEINIK